MHRLCEWRPYAAYLTVTYGPREMQQQSLIHPSGTTCCWCLTEPATTVLYTVPTCVQCAAGTPKDRVLAWQSAVAAKQEGRSR